MPATASNRVDGNKPSRPKLVGPTRRPLFVHMVCTALKGNRSAKQNDRAERAKKGNKSVCRLFGQMFGDLERLHQVKLRINRGRRPQIHGSESTARDQKPIF